MVTRTRAGFGLAEVVVALVVFAIGALGAAALTAHAARLATQAVRREAALLRVVTVLDSLALETAPGPGTSADAHARYVWEVTGDTVRTLTVRAALHGLGDTVRLQARRPSPPPILRSEP